MPLTGPQLVRFGSDGRLGGPGGDPIAGVSAYLSPSGGDDSAALLFALGNFTPYTSPYVVLTPGTFQWNTTVVGLARSQPARVQGSGVGRTIIRLSATAPSVFSLNKIADYDTFSDIEISDLTIDANNILPATSSHVIIGTLAGGATQTKLNLARIYLRRIRTINVATSSTINRANVYLIPQVNVADNPCTITDIVLEDLDLNGGAVGVSIGGTTNDSSGNGNLTHDRIVLQRVRHDTGVLNTGAAYNSENIQIGSRDTGGTVTIRDCHGFNSGDVGIAVLNGRYSHVEDSTVTDARTAAFQAGNFNPNMPADQTHHFKSCHTKIVALNPSNTGVPGYGFHIAGSPNQQLGHVIFQGCSFHTLQTNTPTLGQALDVQNPVVSVLIQDEFHINATSINHTLSANYTGGGILFTPPGNSTLEVRGALRTNISGTIVPGANTFEWDDVRIAGVTNSSYLVDIDTHFMNNALAGAPNSSIKGALIGPGAVLSTPLPIFRGQYRMVVESYAAADTTPFGIVVAPYNSANGTQQITIQPQFTCPDCDFSPFPASAVGHEISANNTNTGNLQFSSGNGLYPLVVYPRLILANNNDNFAKGSKSQWTTTNTGLTSAVPVLNVTGWPLMVWFDQAPTAVSFNRRNDVNAAIAFTNPTAGPYILFPGDSLFGVAAATNITYHTMPYRF